MRCSISQIYNHRKQYINIRKNNWKMSPNRCTDESFTTLHVVSMLSCDYCVFQTVMIPSEDIHVDAKAITAIH